MSDKNFLLIARIVGVHGIRGNLKACSYAESDDIFRNGMKLWLKRGREEGCFYTVEQITPYNKGLRLRIEGINDRNRAESMIGYGLYIEKSRLPLPEADSYYWSDLIGLAVYDKNENFLGKVESIISTGSNDVYVVKDGKKETLIPALAAVVSEINPEAGIMRVELPEGLPVG
ncbi:MAG: ribosome maturation factor RimM [Desulfococcaceae bacterium]|nr:ribosome maturation factor RimM [Desulfococcaceae bacterium]